MASEPYPVASSVIALGEMDKFRRAVLPSIMTAKAISDSLQLARIAESTKTFKGILDTAQTVKRLNPLPDAAFSIPKVLPTATMEASFIFPETVKRSAAMGASFGTLGIVPATLGRDLARVSEMVGQVTRPLDSLRLVRDYQAVLAATARAAEKFVEEDVLPEVVRPGAVPERGLAGQALDWLEELPASKRRALAADIAGALVSVAGVIKAASEGDAYMVVIAVAGYWIALYRFYCLVTDERERRAGLSD